MTENDKVKELKIPDEIKKLSFEEAFKKLQDIIEQFETGDISLDKSINAYKSGVMLKKHCENKLNEAELIVEQIDISKTGEIKLKPFGPEDKI